MTKKILFHHCMEVKENGQSGSSVRPYKMLQAFKSLGYEVLEVTGHSNQRKLLIDKVLASDDYLGLYAESSTMPIALSDPDHVPRNFKLDAEFFSELRRRKIPVTMFYRDAHWKFSEFKQNTSAWKRMIKVPFHKMELHDLKKTCDLLYFPTVAMGKFLDADIEKSVIIKELPPGSDQASENRKFPEVYQQLRLFYVGGITPPLYDHSDLLSLEMSFQDDLTFCVRKQEWEIEQTLKPLANQKWFKVVHQSGAELTKLYLESDLLLYLIKPSTYLSMTYSVKIFESLAFGVPIICYKGTVAAEFVTANKVGWVIENISDLSPLLNRLRNNPLELNSVRLRCLEVNSMNTWEKRAEQVVKDLHLIREQKKS